MSLLLPEDLLCLVPPISGFSIFKGRAQMANGGQAVLSPRGKNLSLANPEKELEGHQGLSCHSLGLAAPWHFLPHPSFQRTGVLLYYLVRHWLILKPWVFIQDRLDSETLDVWDSCS